MRLRVMDVLLNVAMVNTICTVKQPMPAKNTPFLHSQAGLFPSLNNAAPASTLVKMVNAALACWVFILLKWNQECRMYFICMVKLHLYPVKRVTKIEKMSLQKMQRDVFRLFTRILFPAAIQYQQA